MMMWEAWVDSVSCIRGHMMVSTVASRSHTEKACAWVGAGVLPHPSCWGTLLTSNPLTKSH